MQVFGKREDAPEFGIYRLGELYAIRTGESAFGDTVHSSPQEASSYIETVNQRKAEWEEAIRRTEEREELDRIEKEKEEFTHGFADQFSPMKRGRVISTLLKPIRYKGKAYTRKTLVEYLVSEGYRVEDSELKGIDGGFLDSRDLTKTGIDYAKFLTSIDEVCTALWC